MTTVDADLSQPPAAGLAALAQRVRAMRGLKRLGLALSAGALAALSQPPIGAWPCLFVALPLVIWLIDGLGRSRLRIAFAVGWAFGLGYFLVSFYWIGIAFLVDAHTYLWMMPFAVGGLAGGMAVYWGLAVAAAAVLWGRGGSTRLLLLAASLALAEYARGHFFTGFPWTAIGLAALSLGPVAQGASVVGMTGLSFLIVAWAGLPALLSDRLTRAAAGLATALALSLAATWTWGAWRAGGAEPAPVAGVALRIVQPNIPQDVKWRADHAGRIFETLMALSLKPTRARPRGIADVTHVVWPESAVPFPIDESAGALSRIADALPDGSLLITGALRRERRAGGDAVYNSILAFDAEANLVARYDKWRLVPGGEFLPFERLLEPLGFRKVVTVPGSFSAGSGPATIPLGSAPPAGMLICYEAVFPDRLVDAADRPQWLINVTNDGWFGVSTGPYQHLAQARMRAIEQGLPVVRAANTGMSAVIDAKGGLRGTLALGQAGVIDAALSPALPPTLYARFGDVGLSLLIALGLGAHVGRNFKRQSRLPDRRASLEPKRKLPRLT